MTESASNSKATSTPRVGDKGQVADLPLPRLLVDLHRTRFCGALELERGNTHKRIVFHKGAPVLSESNLATETLGVQLIDQGTITQDDHARVSAYMKNKDCKEGVALLALELLKPKALFLALKEQVRRRLLEAFAWSDGRFELCSEANLDSNVQSMRSDPLALIREGLVSHWTPDRLLADLTDLIEQFPNRTKDFDEAQRRLADGDEIVAVFDRIDGSVPLGTAIGGAFNSPDVLASVWILAMGKMLRFEHCAAQQAGAEGSDGAFDQVEIEVVSKPTGAAPAAERSTGGEAAKSRSKPGTDDASEEMRKQVLSLLEGLESRCLYELLGVARDASEGEIRKAYFKAAKRFHPDALTHLGLVDIKEQAAAVFARIAEANDVLRDAVKRAAYDAGGSNGRADIDTAALGQAETFYRKGEILIRMGDFRGALEYLESAVELWPEECAYQSGLGWALYKQPRSDRERALVHLERAVALDESDATALHRLGTVLRAAGEVHRGAECLARARMIDPSIE